MKKVTYRVEGMSCNGCAASVTRVLNRNEAVVEADVKLETGLAQVTYDETKTNDDFLIKLIDNLGYKASVKE